MSAKIDRDAKARAIERPRVHLRCIRTRRGPRRPAQEKDRSALRNRNAEAPRDRSLGTNRDAVRCDIEFLRAKICGELGPPKARPVELGLLAPRKGLEQCGRESLGPSSTPL